MKDNQHSSKKLKKDREYQKRIDLIYDFEFAASCQSIEASADGNYIVATGQYPPRAKIFDLNEMSLKVERGLDSEVAKLKILSEDYSKIAYLCNDRTVEIHAKYGKHFKTRIPVYGRDMTFDKFLCELLFVGASSHVYRLNLQRGQFMKPFDSNAESINCVAFNEQLNITGTGGDKGVVELWDTRTKSNRIFALKSEFTLKKFSHHCNCLQLPQYGRRQCRRNSRLLRLAQTTAPI